MQIVVGITLFKGASRDAYINVYDIRIKTGNAEIVCWLESRPKQRITLSFFYERILR